MFNEAPAADYKDLVQVLVEAGVNCMFRRGNRPERPAAASSLFEPNQIASWDLLQRIRL